MNPHSRFHFLCAFFFFQLLADGASIPGISIVPYNSRLWTSGEGLARDSVQAIAQTPDGFLWVGTQDGLARFDGHEFKFFPVGTNGVAKSQRINTLSVTGNDSLFVGTAQGLFQFQQGRWTTLLMSTNLDSTILSLQPSAAGSVWIGTSRGLLLYENEKLSLAHEPTAKQPIRCVATNDAGLWFGAGDGVILMRDGSMVANYSLAEFQPDFIRAICPRRDGSIWIGSNSGLTRFADGRYTHFTKADGLPDNTITSVYEDRRGNLWIGTFGGLCRFAAGKFFVETTQEGELYDQIFCFFEDHEDNLWIGAKDGLHQLNARQFTTYTTRHGLAHNNVISVYEDKDGALWIGTWGGGLHCLRDGQMTIYNAENSSILRNDKVLAIRGAREGGIWFGEDYDGGLYRFKNGEFKHFGDQEGMPRSSVRDLLEDQNGRLLVAHGSAGIGFLDKNNDKFTFYGSKQRLPTKAARCLLQTKDGRIWLGTESGLCYWKKDHFVTFTTKDGLADDVILSLYEDKKANLWIGTGGGLSRIRKTPNAIDPAPSNVDERFNFSSYTTQQGLFDNNVLEILEDDLENLWVASRRGVFRVFKNDLNDLDAGKITKVACAGFEKADGLMSPVCVGVAKPSACKTRDGRMWFATTKGLGVTDPKWRIDKNEKAPPVVIQQVVADKAVQSLKFEVKPQENSSTINLEPETLNLPAGRGELEFHYTALSFVAPEKNRFKYKLDGVDSGWVDAGTRHTAFYNNTPPGDYTFHVIACNNDGVWNSIGKNIKFSILPHYWQTWWFKFSLVFASLSLAATTARYATKKRMHRRLQRLEQQHAVEKERARIARDMHDDLGAQLTTILLVTDQIRQREDNAAERTVSVNKLSRTAREMVDSLDALVWAVKPGNDSLDRLASYIGDYAHTYFEGTPICCRLDFPENLPARAISSGMRHNLFLVIKEALNNAMKHAACSEILIQLEMDDSGLTFIIHDNGKGFPKSEDSGQGNGLQNMNDRVKNMNGSFSLSSEPGKGTRIKIQVPLKGP